MPLAIYPDILLFAWIVVVLFIDLFAPAQRKTGLILNLSALFMFGLSIFTICAGRGKLGNYDVREWTVPFRFIFDLCAMLSLLLVRPAFKHGAGRQTLEEPGVFVILLLTSTLGMHVLGSSSELITFFLGLEMATLPLYALSTWHRDNIGAEAGLKYLLIGALSTALLLFGCSFLYGAGGTLRFDYLMSTPTNNGFMHLGTLFIICALMFKLSVAPFHMWAPDVYAGAPSAVTAFIASASKAAGVMALIMLFKGPCSNVLPDMDQTFVLLAAISMLVGNFGALKQTSFNRFMAYSSIAQIGFVMMALSGEFGKMALPTVAFYMVVYAISNYLAFFVMQCLAEKRAEAMPSLRGLSQQSPLLALCMTIAMFSLAGIPPLAGFLGKLPLFFAAAEGGHYVLVLFAALNAVIALYYYMLVVKESYMVEPEGDVPAITISASQRWALFLLVVGVITLGVCPQVHTWVFGIFGR